MRLLRATTARARRLDLSEPSLFRLRGIETAPAVGQRVASRAAGASSRPGSKIDTQQPIQDVAPIGARRAVSGGPGVAADDELFLERLQSGEDAAFEASGPSSTSEGCQPRGTLQVNNTVEKSPTGEQAPRA